MVQLQKASENVRLK